MFHKIDFQKAEADSEHPSDNGFLPEVALYRVEASDTSHALGPILQNSNSAES
jgi:hypothetical protein